MKKITLAFLMLFTSLFAIGQCDYTLELNDSFGDGWNGNSIDVIVNGTIVLDDATLDAGSQGFETFSVTDGDAITFTVDDSGSFDGEVSYRILNNIDQEVGAGDLTDVPTEIAANCIDCTPADVVITAKNECESQEFSVRVEVVSLGSAPTITFTNDIDDSTLEVTEEGTYFIGPFDSGTSVVLSSAGDDTDCDTTYDAITLSCDLPNDDCTGAIPIEDNETITASTTTATEDFAGCGVSDLALGIWYVINTGDVASDITVSLAGSDFDTEVSIFSGTCNALTCEGNNDDSNGTLQSEITFTTDGLGTNYYILATGFSDSTGELSLTVTGDNLLSTESGSDALDGFSMFPNPATNVLNVAAASTISNVKVYNLVGQVVVNQSVNALSDAIDVSNLKSGAYLVQVTAEGQTGTYKFIKQ